MILPVRFLGMVERILEDSLLGWLQGHEAPALEVDGDDPPSAFPRDGGTDLGGLYQPHCDVCHQEDHLLGVGVLGLPLSPLSDGRVVTEHDLKVVIFGAINEYNLEIVILNSSFRKLD